VFSLNKLSNKTILIRKRSTLNLPAITQRQFNVDITFQKRRNIV